MSWRYQPVYVDEGGERTYSLCEVYFDKKGRLESWTADPAMRALGNDPQDLRGSITMMLADAYKWKAVDFNSLKPGREFERAVPQVVMDEVADIIDLVTTKCSSAETQLN